MYALSASPDGDSLRYDKKQKVLNLLSRLLLFCKLHASLAFDNTSVIFCLPFNYGLNSLLYSITQGDANVCRLQFALLIDKDFEPSLILLSVSDSNSYYVLIHLITLVLKISIYLKFILKKQPCATVKH